MDHTSMMLGVPTHDIMLTSHGLHLLTNLRSVALLKSESPTPLANKCHGFFAFLPHFGGFIAPLTMRNPIGVSYRLRKTLGHNEYQPQNRSIICKN